MKAFLDYASSKYYSGDPIISDDEFDRLANYSGYERVGAPVTTSNRVTHPFAMWSLQKCYDDEPLIELPGKVVETPKLDGAAVANYYIFGKHSLSLTRGDGKAGLDITNKMRLLIPQTIPFSEEPIIQVTGEVVAPKTVENSRNYAAGALNLKCIEEFRLKTVTFIAYGIKPSLYDTWSEDMEKLYTVAGIPNVLSMSEESLNEFPQDGKVFRVDNNSKFESLGYTSKHPRGAFALKERKGGVVTKLLDVEWQVGRSGIVSPVAILEPVKIGDALVSRATLHNYKYITELNLDYNCYVEVIRSGEIIPKVVRRVYIGENDEEYVT